MLSRPPMRMFLLLGLLAGCARIERSSPAPVPSTSTSDLGAALGADRDLGAALGADRDLGAALGADDAGRGEYEMKVDGPFCVGRAPHIDRTRPLGSRVEPTRQPLPTSGRLFDFFALTSPPPAHSDRTDVRFVISGPSKAPAGTELHFVATMLNQSANALAIAQLVDGSSERWRWPFVETYLQEVGGETLYVWTHGPDFGRCGNVNERTAGDFTRIAAHEGTKDPFGPWGHPLEVTIERPGHYRLWSVYVACEGAEYGIALGTASGAFRPADLVTGPLVSNAVELEITAP